MLWLEELCKVGGGRTVLANSSRMSPNLAGPLEVHHLHDIVELEVRISCRAIFPQLFATLEDDFELVALTFSRPWYESLVVSEVAP